MLDSEAGREEDRSQKMFEFNSTACERIEYRWKYRPRCSDYKTGNTAYFASFGTDMMSLCGTTFDRLAVESAGRTSRVIKIMGQLCADYLRLEHLLCTL